MDTELKQLARRAVELRDQCVALQEETNRLQEGRVRGSR